MTYQYRVTHPYITEKEFEYVTDALDSRWLSTHGPYVARLEKAFADRHGTEHGVACASGTAALILALRALGIGPGDEVIVPEFTMVISAWAVTYTGATPVFVDCHDDLTIDTSLIEEKITPRTKAIMPVHVYGRSCDMHKIMELAYEYNLRVIEDSAEATGVSVTGDVACFSLGMNKIVSSGEGGVCLTNDKRLAKQITHIRTMAFNSAHTFLHKKMAYNFRLTNLQAAVGVAQMEKLDEILTRRKEIEAYYNAGLNDVENVTIMPDRDVVWMYDLLCDDRDGLMRYLDDAGIETRVYFKPMSRQPMYLNPDYTSLKAHYFAEHGLYLPTYPQLRSGDQDRIIDQVRTFCAKKTPALPRRAPRKSA